ncbi:MAG: GNAT family N-acetyltransferase [Flavobacteriaceae bacterium TMED220]|nr:MAG: GNAT family N-acetyltransferase [Flavobacteriaceae bacterium TMED220]
MNKSIEIHKISSEMTLNLRREILRNNTIESNLCHFKWDKHEKSFHLGAFNNKKIVGIISILNTSTKTNNIRRLRGMAVKKKYQKNGIGSKLISRAEEILVSENIFLIWLKAREKAINFYLKKGYRKIGEPFEIINIGIHYYCEKKLNK